MASLLAALAVIGGFQQGFRNIIPQVALAVLTAVIFDMLLRYFSRKETVFPSSAFITGMIIALVLSPGIRWYVPVAASGVAILQKYIIRYRGRHIFNPANFGLLSAIFIFLAYPTWWGHSFSPLIVAVGVFISYKMKRLRLPVIFAAVFSILFAVDNLFSGRPISDSIGLVNLFFLFIMLPEPMTCPKTGKGVIIYAVSAAILSFIFFKAAPAHDFSILALAAANALVPFLNRLE